MNSSALTVDTTYGSEEAAMQAYLTEGERRALSLENRGPIRFDSNGQVHHDILDAYWKHGFYVFEGVLSSEEVADLEADFQALRARFPTERGSLVDAQGRPALGVGLKMPVLQWAKPLSDPIGGTSQLRGRHPVKMYEPTPSSDAPDEIVYVVMGPLQFSEAALRLYGHPQLLAVAAAVNGDDFTPFSEQIFIKEPGRGASVAWHQDGTTHWNKPGLHQGSHGFNFMAQLYGSTAANGLWVVPGSHRSKADIKGLVAEAGSERLPDAVPIICNPGDVAITNRQALHASFANTSADWRVTFNFGFHRRDSVLGAERFLPGSPPGSTYDDASIDERARIIGYAIDARQKRFPEEAPFVYAPHAADGAPRLTTVTSQMLRDYSLLDLAI